MTKFKDSEAINNIIIEMAKSNNWVSRNDLIAQTGKVGPTIINYLENDISGLIEINNTDFFENVKRNTGTAKTLVIKYKLKSGLDNLLAIFNFIEDKNDLKGLMQTDYYKALIPEIEKKCKNEFKKVKNDHKVSKSVKTIFDIGFNCSPSFIHFVLKHDSKNIESNETLRKLIPKGLSTDFLFSVCYGLIIYDNLEGTINDQDIISQI